MKRALVFVLTTAVFGLACHRPPAISDQADPNVAPAMIDAGGDFVPNQAVIPPFVADAGKADDKPSAYSGFASAPPGFHLQLSEAHFGLGRRSSSWSDTVTVDDDGSLFAKVRNGCAKGNVGKAGVAKIVAAINANAYFDPPNFFGGPTDSGSTDLHVRSGGREKIMGFRGSLLEPISPGTIVGTFTITPDGGIATDTTQHPVDTTVSDLPRRKQLAAVLKVVHAVTALSSRPVFKCPVDVDSRFDER